MAHHSEVHPRSLQLSLALIGATIAGGLMIRLAHLGLPFFITKYSGSILWALMLYWIASTVLSRWQLAFVATLTGFVATAFELFKLHHSPALDAFRLTLPGVLLLGRFFSIKDIAAYWLAIAAGSIADQVLRAPTRPQP